MFRFVTVFCLLAVSSGTASRAAAVADEGFEVGGARELRVSGTVFDSKSRAVVSDARVSIETSSGTYDGATGPDGRFLVTAKSAQGLGTVSIAFDHADYQQKYLETVLRDALEGNVEVRVSPGHAHMKAKKLDLDLGCDGHASVATKAIDTAPFRVVCEDGKTGIEVTLRGSTIAVLASGPFTVKFESGRLSIRDSANETIDLRVGAAMLRR